MGRSDIRGFCTFLTVSKVLKWCGSAPAWAHGLLHNLMLADLAMTHNSLQALPDWYLLCHPVRQVTSSMPGCLSHALLVADHGIVFSKTSAMEWGTWKTSCCLQLVTRMQMLNKGCGVISWRLRGQLGALPIDIDFQSTFELDLITGRVRAKLQQRLLRLGSGLRSAVTCSRSASAGH